MIKGRSISSIYRRAYKKNKDIYRSVSLELTHNCNFKCCHCYVRSHKVEPYHLKTADYVHIAKELKKIGCLQVTLTGGEPLLHPCFNDIYCVFKREGFLVVLMTNGYALTDDHFDMFDKMPPALVEISLYGFESKVFQSVTNTNYDCNVVKKNIVRLVNSGIQVNLKSVIMQENAHELDEYKSFAKKNGSSFRYDLTLHPTIRKDVKPCEHLLCSSVAGKILISDSIKSKKLKKKYEYIKRNVRFRNVEGTECSYFSCGLGRRTFVIDPVGFVFPCFLVRIGNKKIIDMSINEILHDCFDDVYNMKRKIIPCDNCDSRQICNFCEGILYLHGGDETIVSHYCQIVQTVSDS